MDNFEDLLSHQNSDIILPRESDQTSVNNESNENVMAGLLTYEDPNESSLLNSIVEAVMRGDMNEVVSLALSHRNPDSKDRGIVDHALSTALRNKFRCDQMKEVEIQSEKKSENKEKEDQLIELKNDSNIDNQAADSIYSTTTKGDEDNKLQCSYYIDSNSVTESNLNNTYCQSGFHNQNNEFENNSEDHVNENFSQYHPTTSSFTKYENVNTLKPSQQSVQVQLPGIGNFLLQLPSNFKPGEPITLPISLPLTPSSQTSGGNPISINMNTGQIISNNQLLSLYNPSCINGLNVGRKMRAIAPKPSKPLYRQPLIAPKTDSPNVSTYNQDCINTTNSTPLPAPSGPGRRKGAKGKKVGRKRGAQPKSRKESSYASSTHSIDSQDTIQYNESNTALKQNCSNYISSRNTYQCNYFVNNDSSDYINQTHVIPQSYNEIHSNNLIDTSDSGEKDLLSLAWEISNADLGNNDDFSTTYQLYDTNNMSSESFVSSEILDQFLQNIQKDELSDLSRCSSTQINLDQRVSYASSFTTLPPCSTVLPSVTTSNYLNNSSNNQSSLELSQCIEIAEVVNLNTEDMLSELEKDENALLDKFVAQYSSTVSCSHNSQRTGIMKYGNIDTEFSSFETKTDYSEKDLDPTVKESNELSEIAKQIEKDCDVSGIRNSSMNRNYLSHHNYDYHKEVDHLTKSNNNIISCNHDTYLSPDVDNFCGNVASSIDLLYPTTTDSVNSTVLDGKDNYIMSVNVDTKLQNEVTYYIANGSLKSKTLDDFGLLDFCTNARDNQINELDCLDDKRYLEPPILEDISDATPIPSDEESVDEDIDLCAFTLSKLNHVSLLSNRVYQNKLENIDGFWSLSKMNDLLALLDTAPLQNQSFSSENWYIYDNFINMPDPFSFPNTKNENIEDMNDVSDIQNDFKNSSIKSLTRIRGNMNVFKTLNESDKNRAIGDTHEYKLDIPDNIRRAKINMSNSLIVEQTNANIDQIDIKNNFNKSVTKHERRTRNTKKSFINSICKGINNTTEIQDNQNKVEECSIIEPTKYRIFKRNLRSNLIDDKFQMKHRKIRRNINYSVNNENRIENNQNVNYTIRKDNDNDKTITLTNDNNKNIVNIDSINFETVNNDDTENHFKRSEHYCNKDLENDDSSNAKSITLNANSLYCDLNNKTNEVENVICIQPINESAKYITAKDCIYVDGIDMNVKSKSLINNAISELNTNKLDVLSIDLLERNILDYNGDALNTNYKTSRFDQHKYEVINTDESKDNGLCENKNRVSNAELVTKTNQNLDNECILDMVNIKNKTCISDIHDLNKSEINQNNMSNIERRTTNHVVSNYDDHLKYTDILIYHNKPVDNDKLNNLSKVKNARDSFESNVLLNSETIDNFDEELNVQKIDDTINDEVIPIEHKKIRNKSSTYLNEVNKNEIGKDHNMSMVNIESTKSRKNKSKKDFNAQSNIFDTMSINQQKDNLTASLNVENGNKNSQVDLIEIPQSGCITECSKLKRIQKNTIKDYNLCNYKDRQSRLRKPPMKLAIYHSIKFIENEFLPKHGVEAHVNKDIEINKIRKEVVKSPDQLITSKINILTRSKGLISKSFDSFYETLEKSKKHQHPKMKNVKHHLNNKNKYKCNSVKNEIEHSNVKNPIDRINANTINYKRADSHNLNIKNILTDKSIYRNTSSLKTTKSKEISNVSKKYNLRKQSDENHRSPKSHLDKKSKNVNLTSELKQNRPNKLKNIVEQNSFGLIEADSKLHHINTNDIIDVENIFIISLELNLITEERLEVFENNLYELHSANIAQKLSCNVFKVFKNSAILESKTIQDSVKKSFPVRKINRKLRLLSGLEYEKHLSKPTLFDFENFETLTEYVLHFEMLVSSIFSNSLIAKLDCTPSTINEFVSTVEYQVFENNEDDFDDADSCDARLVIVENEDILTQIFVNSDNSQTTSAAVLDNLSIGKIQNETILNTEYVESINVDTSKRYSLRNKSKDTITRNCDIFDGTSIVSTPCKKQAFKRSYKRNESVDSEVIFEKTTFDDCDIAFNNSVMQPFCLVENIMNDIVIIDSDKHSLSLSKVISFQNNSLDENELIESSNDISEEMKLRTSNDDTPVHVENEIVNIKTMDEIASKILKRIKENKFKLQIYRNHVRFIWRTKLYKNIKYSVRLKKKLQTRNMFKLSHIEENLAMIENGIAKLNFEPEDLPGKCEYNQNEYVEVSDDNSKNNLCMTVDSNNVETFSRSYGSFSLKIKFQKQDPVPLQEDKPRVTKGKKSSKKRKKLRHFLNSIIRSSDTCCNKSNSGYESYDDDSNNESKYSNTRKRKHSTETIYSIDSSNQENINQNDKPPKLTPESIINDDYYNDEERQKPIKIKLFKSTNEDCSKSKEMFFSLQKSIPKEIKERSPAPKMLQVLKDQQFKPSRQAANLAKKKIFSTAKEDRRSQNATLTSIWNPRKVNNALNKLPSDFLKRCNDCSRRPRGRPPKSNRLPLFLNKYNGSSGTLKLKIRLSKDFKNCNDDNLSSNGENSGRTSTNDSSILNSAVAGINAPSDALSLESNNFINGITQHLNDNIDYLEVKEAKVYFDPNQVDIEKIKNSYYSSKKDNSMHFDNSISQQNLYVDSSSELSDEKKNALSSNNEFSNYNDSDSSVPYNNLSNSYSCNNISHLPKELINVSDNCYNPLSTNREPQDLSQSVSQSYSYNNQAISPGKNQFDLWQSSKANSDEFLSTCRNGNNPWFSKHHSFPNSSAIYDSYSTLNNKEPKSCSSQIQSSPFMVCDNETPDSKQVDINLAKLNSNKEARKSNNNSFESISQLSPNQSRFGAGSISSQLNMHKWCDETNHNASLNHTAAAWMTYAQQQAAAAAYIDPQMKAYYNLALSQSMLSNSYCGAYGNPTGNPENFYSSLHSQYLNNSKELMEKSHSSGTVRNHNETMGTIMEAAQISSWEHFYSAAAMAGYHNSSQGAMDDYAGRAGNMLQAHHMLAGSYPGSVLSRDHFPIEVNKPPVAHQNQSGSNSPLKPISSPTPISSAPQAYSHVQMPYNHFNGTPVGFF